MEERDHSDNQCEPLHNYPIKNLYFNQSECIINFTNCRVLGSKGLRGSRRDYGGERATNLRDRRSSHNMEDEERRHCHRSQRDRERESGRDRDRRSNWRERESESRRERHSSSRRHNRRSNSRSRSRSKSPHV